MSDSADASLDPDGNEDVDSFLKKQINLYNLQVAIDQIVAGLAASTAPFRLSEALIKQFHAIAMAQLLDEAGSYRRRSVVLVDSPYVPPNWVEVPALMETLCSYVADEWDEKNLLHLAAFTLWRLNWIHPFRNGNGRTARATSYLVLCARHGRALPPKNTVMQQLLINKREHDKLLHQADTAYAATQNIDAAVKPLADFMGILLTNQLRSYFET